MSLSSCNFRLIARCLNCCETIETEVVRLAVARTLGQDVSVKDLGYTVEYNRRFVLSGVDQIIAQAKEFLSLNVTTQVPELARVFVRRILDQLTRPSDTRYQDVVDEITAAQFDATAGPRSFTPLGA